MSLLVGTPVADTFYRIVYRPYLEPIRQGYGRDINHLETIGLVADFTIEMRMHTGIGPETDNLVFLRAAPILERMDELLLAEKVQCPEYTGLVHGLQTGLKVRQGKRTTGPEHRIKHKDTVCGRLYAIAFEKFNAAFVHTVLHLVNRDPGQAQPGKDAKIAHSSGKSVGVSEHESHIEPGTGDEIILRIADIQHPVSLEYDIDLSRNRHFHPRKRGHRNEPVFPV